MGIFYYDLSKASEKLIKFMSIASKINNYEFKDKVIISKSDFNGVQTERISRTTKEGQLIAFVMTTKRGKTQFTISNKPAWQK